MIDRLFQTKYQAYCIDPLLRSNWIRRLTPSMITLFGLFFGTLIPWFLFLGFSMVPFICLLLSGFCDTLDGALARHKNTSTDQGAALDITCDRVVEFAVILGLFLVDPSRRGLSCILMLGSTLFCITTFLVVGIFTQNKEKKSFFYSPGIIERAEAFAFYAAMILFPASFSSLALLYTVLVALTGAIRIYQFLTTMPLKELDIEKAE